MLFDVCHKGAVTTKGLGHVMRNLGMLTDEQELVDMIDEVDADGSGTMDFPEFLALMSRKMNTEEIEEDMKEAFRVFDKQGNGFIAEGELRHVMANIGSKMTNDEIDEMIKKAPMSETGMVDYEG
ncbi:hypothetical protein NP493_877g02000 [Ridgeia piscesae]|uniref:EF-hand domain-containing protein n=1 Tax=Ridgeia piscesae TaxID=27915 RepID=A0AAD9KL95_RIDPI|nr:hypothetical protein NP493_877g02000 [Ridgeia piscesae]